MTVPVRVGVLDYGSGNLHSVCQALTAAGADVTLSSDWAELDFCEGLVVPGVGALAACMAGLKDGIGARFIEYWLDYRRPLLGICVGHQVLFGSGVEHGVYTAGLGALPGVVERLVVRRLPHMGWNTVEPPPTSAMFAGVAGERFYFVHSYAVHQPVEGISRLSDDQVTWCKHEGDRFVAAVEGFNMFWSTQFHPEKSGAAGARVLRNWLSAISEGVYR